MKLDLHLISMPWPPLNTPSIQTGALKAFVDRELGTDVTCSTYSAFLEIPIMMDGAGFADTYRRLSSYGETAFFVLYAKKFIRGVSWKKLLPQGLGEAKLLSLERAADEYLDKRVLPRLNRKRKQIVGFTLNFDQVYSSLYAARFLKEKSKQDLTFIYGGFSAALPNVFSVFRAVDAEGYAFFGEGEGKLVSFLRSRISGANGGIPGVVSVSDDLPLTERPHDFFASQFRDLNELPLPDYKEYFEVFERNFASRVSAEYRRNSFIAVEGTRGCFAKCDFCGLNYLWNGFRKHSSKRVFDTVENLCRRHRTSRVQFVDNVCDTWAESFADTLISRQKTVDAMMELRVHHPESFWTKLSLAGVNQIQLGIEAVSPRLILAVKKGTTAIQNLRAHKYLKELGVLSASNIITHHPRSTFNDVNETKRILESTLHWGPLNLVRFHLDIGSPLFNSLPKHEKERLVPLAPFKVDSGLEQFLVGNGYEVSNTSLALENRTSRAWDQFTDWYGKLIKRKSSAGTLIARKSFGSVVITDTRTGTKKQIELRGAEAELYDFCHEGPRLAVIEKRLGGKVDWLEILNRFAKKKIVLEVSGHYISLALRPREDLVKNLETTKSISGAVAADTALQGIN